MLWQPHSTRVGGNEMVSPWEETGHSRAWPPLCPPLLWQEGTRYFQDRSLGCIRRSWQKGFKFSSILVSGGTSIWILFAVPWQGSLSRTADGKWSGRGRLPLRPGPQAGRRQAPQSGPGWGPGLPLMRWVTSRLPCHCPHLGFLT